jgi:hypothetical protein
MKTKYLEERKWMGFTIELDTFQEVEELRKAHRTSRSDALRYVLREGLKVCRARDNAERQPAGK